MRKTLIVLWLAAGLTACDDFHDDRDERHIRVTVRHDTGQPAADVTVETLDAEGEVESEAATDINGGAWVAVDEDDPTVSLRIDGKAVYLDLPADDATVVLKGESTPRTVDVTFRPVLAAGDTWFHVLAANQTALERNAPGESVTVRVPAAPRHFFVAAGNDAQGVVHAALINFDGGGDALFTDPIAAPVTAYAQKITVSVTGLAEAPSCRHQALLRLEHQTAALVYPMTATGFTVYSFSTVRIQLEKRSVNLPNGLACTYTAPSGACQGKPVTALVPLIGIDDPISVDWSTTELVPASPDDYELIGARLTNAKATQPYSREKGGFCMAVNDFMDWSYLSADLAVPLGEVHVERFMTETPDEIDVLAGLNPQVIARDDDAALHLSAACPDCYDVARITGRDADDAVVTVYAPMTAGSARVPRALLERRDTIEAYGYQGAFGYAETVTLPMQGYGIKPGESTLIPYSPRTTFFSWRSDR